MNWEDFKNNIRNGLLTKKVISSEVGSHITIPKEEIQKYYDEHKQEFVRPEQVALRSIEVNTAGKDPTEIADLKKKAETALKRIQDGEDFAEIAKRYSDGATAKQGGYLGIYKRGELSKELEDMVFKMKRNDLTDVMETKQGFLIMQVLEHYDEGEQPLAKVNNDITDKLYGERMEPALRDYLKTLREESYVVIKPGYQDIAGGSNSEIQEVSATPEVTKSKKGRKKFLLFGKRRLGLGRLMKTSLRLAISAREQTITSFFLVHEKEIRNTRAGKSYLRLELGDRSGTIEAVMWDQFEAVGKRHQPRRFRQGPAPASKFTATSHSLLLQQLRLAKPEEVDLADFLPHTKEDVGKLWAQLLEYANSIENPWLKKLVNGIITDPAVAPRYKRAPAAKVMHHAYLGGLLEHVIGLCGLAKQVAAHYPELNLDFC